MISGRLFLMLFEHVGNSLSFCTKVPILRFNVLGNLRRCVTQSCKRGIQIGITRHNSPECVLGRVNIQRTFPKWWQPQSQVTKGGHLPSAFSSLLSFVSLELKMGDQLSNQNMISAVVGS